MPESVKKGFKWSITENHWSKKTGSDRQEILSRISVGWGKKPKTGKWVKCPVCGKEVWRKLFHLKRSKTHYCSKECLAKSKKGIIPQNIEVARANSPFKCGAQNLNWKGGISSYPKEWKRVLKEKVRARDKNCQHCGKENDLVVHHKDLEKHNCEMENLILLCRSCHTKLHWKLDIRATRLKRWNTAKNLLAEG